MSATFFAVVGNCQARFIACVLSTIPKASAAAFTQFPQEMEFEGVTAPMYGMEMLAAEVERRRAQGDRIVICEQTTPIAPKGLVTAEVPRDQIIYFPHVECFALWPYVKFDPERAQSLGPEKLLRIDKINIKKSSEKADFDMLPYFERRFKQVIPFDSPRHPSAALFADLLVEIISRLEPDSPIGSMESWHTRISASRGIGSSYRHPVTFRFAEALGCEWVNSVPYRRWSEACSAMSRRDWSAALTALLEVRTRKDEHPDFFLMIGPTYFQRLAICLHLTGDTLGAERSLQDALALRPPHQETLIRASFCHAIGDYPSAIKYRLGILAEKPDALNVTLALAQSYIAAGSFNESLRLLHAVPLGKRNRIVWNQIGNAEIRVAQAHLLAAKSAFAEIKTARSQNEFSRLRDQIDKAVASLDDRYFVDVEPPDNPEELEQ